MLLRPALLFLMTLLFSACAEKGEGPVLSSGERYVSAASAVSDYRLGVGDRVKVSVFNEPSLTGEFWVNPDGTISLPLIGNVPAADRPVSEIARDAQARFADGYLRDPKVAMEVIDDKTRAKRQHVAQRQYEIEAQPHGALVLAGGSVIRDRRQPFS